MPVGETLHPRENDEQRERHKAEPIEELENRLRSAVCHGQCGDDNAHPQHVVQHVNERNVFAIENGHDDRMQRVKEVESDGEEVGLVVLSFR